MQPSAADRSARGRNFSGRGGRRHEIERAGAEGGGGAAAACHGIPRYENNGALSGLGDGSAGNAVDFAQRRRQELAEQHPKALRPPKLLHVKTAVQEQRSSTPQAFLRRRGHRDVRRSKVDRARVEQQLPRAAVPASARLRRDVDTAEPAQRSSFAASRAAEVRAFTPVVPPRGRAAPSVLRLRGDERRVAVTRGFLRRRVAAKWGFLRRRCRLRRRGRPQPRWQETTVSRRRFERRAYRASVPPEVAAPAGPAVPAAARDQREHSSERRYRVLWVAKVSRALPVTCHGVGSPQALNQAASIGLFKAKSLISAPRSQIFLRSGAARLRSPKMVESAPPGALNFKFWR